LIGRTGSATMVVAARGEAVRVPADAFDGITKQGESVPAISPVGRISTMRTWICAWFLSALAVIGGGTRGAAPAAGSGRPLEINFIDVMGGAATLVVTPDRESILIDSGWPGYQDRDPRRIVHVLKDLAGCDHLDHLVTTHWHRDHFGGVEGLSRSIRI